MLFKALSRFSTAQGSLGLVYDNNQRVLRGNLNMYVRNDAIGQAYNANLKIRGTYNQFSGNLEISPTVFFAASFEISKKEFFTAEKFWFKCAQINKEMNMELWAKLPNTKQYIRFFMTNSPADAERQEWYLTTPSVQRD